MIRRRFLEASAQAGLGTWLGHVFRLDRAVLASRPFSSPLPATVPFVGEGAFPVERTVGAGLGRRRAFDLSTLTVESLDVLQERFFIRTGCPDRLPPAASWSVRVRGLVEVPLEIPIGELRREASHMGTHLLECAGNSRAAHFGFMSAARWRGVKLLHLLDRARPLPRATRVLVAGFDEHAASDRGSMPGASWIFSLADIGSSGAFLATEMNGDPLSPDHGHPVRLVVPGWYACTAIKWVDAITLLDDDAPATGHMQEYAGRTHQDTLAPRLARDFQPATIDPAAVPVRVERIVGEGRVSYRIVGTAWGGSPRAYDLRIRLDPGVPYEPVETIAPASGPWVLWSHTAPALAPGRHRIELAVHDPAVRARRLGTGFYAREVQIP